jgi:hypothetical protein
MKIGHQRVAHASAAIIAAVGLLAGAPAAASSVHHASRTESNGRVPSATKSGELMGVAATSASNAWAVGSSNASRSGLILHWNGKAWKQVRSPAAKGSFLNGVAATSAGDAWAVGSGRNGGGLTLHWNGKAWKRVPSPAVASPLFGVAVTSARNAWAVGGVILHWNGKAWKRVPSPVSAGLYAVAATSARNAWAVGTDSTGGVILHWNGNMWKEVPSPAPKGSFLNGVAATSTGNAWAVGQSSSIGIQRADQIDTTLTLRWNGKTWKRMPSPSPGAGEGGLNSLSGVAAPRANRAWAVGWSASADGRATTLILRWNGKAWKRVPSPGPGSNLWGIAVIAADDAWAVGATSSPTSTTTLTVHWNGRAWK